MTCHGYRSPLLQWGIYFDEDKMNFTWWRHQMETFSALLALCAGNSPVPAEFPAQRPVTRSFDDFFDLRLNKRLCKQSWGWWFETPSRPLWRHRNEVDHCKYLYVVKVKIIRIGVWEKKHYISNVFIHLQIMLSTWCLFHSHLSELIGAWYLRNIAFPCSGNTHPYQNGRILWHLKHYISDMFDRYGK